MNDWMNRLARHYKEAQRLYPNDRLLILFDIDGTILDMRYMIHYVLKDYDHHHGTAFFETLKVGDITVHETEIEQLIGMLSIPPERRSDIYEWYVKHCWSMEAIMEAHRPFSGVMEVIRWFQIQPNTFVGLNTGRPESIRDETISSLNKIGKAYKVNFGNRLCYMNRHGWNADVATSKVAAFLHFQKMGFRVFAFVDNEPENLAHVADCDPQGKVLMLHADTIFRSQRKRIPPGAASGDTYNIQGLIDEKSLPDHVQFVWHGVNDRRNLERFLASNIRWAEFDLHLDGKDRRIVLGDQLLNTCVDAPEQLYIDEVIDTLLSRNKSVKLDLKENGPLIERVICFLKKWGVSDSNIWFNADVHRIQEIGFRTLAMAFPGAIIQSPIDFMVPLILSTPSKACALLDNLSKCGINRLSLSWKNPDMRSVLDTLDTWGFEINIYNVPDLESFLKAVLLLPDSITSDFDLPQWPYYDRTQSRSFYTHVSTTHVLEDLLL